MAPKQTLLLLPAPELRHVFDFLEKKDLDYFRLVSRACRALSEPVVFRTVTLHDETQTAEDINEHICDRLHSPKDYLSQYVRHLKVGPFKQEQHCPSAPALAQALSACTNLLDFSWNARMKVHESILETLSTFHPETRLHVTNHMRSSQYLPLDVSLLSSQQLYSLDLTVCGQWVVPRPRTFEYRSELPRLKSALLRARELKVLRIFVTGNVPCQESWVTHTNPDFDFEDGEVFPNLEELSLPFDHYVLTADHCARWTRAMDWSCLRRLDLNHGAPKHLFSVLTGKVPKLRALHFGFWPNHSPDRTWECLDVSVIVKLLESIHGLQQLEATNMNMAEFQNILNDPVFAKLGRTLKMLRVSFTAAAAKGWTLDDVQSMTESCPGLQVLGLKIAMETDTTVPYTSTIWPVAAIEKLKCLTQLRELSLVLQLDENSTEFIVASDGNQHIIKPAAQDRTLSLIRNWRASQRGSELKKCVVRYQTILPFTEHAYTVTSSGTLDSPLELQTDVTGLPAVISLHPFY